jgi:hypothetical protein
VAPTLTGQDCARSGGVAGDLLGLSRMFEDDHAQLDAGMLVYDALYRWSGMPLMKLTIGRHIAQGNRAVQSSLTPNFGENDVNERLLSMHPF